MIKATMTITSVEAAHILAGLRQAFKQSGEWCEIDNGIAAKMLPIAQAQGFHKDWECIPVNVPYCSGRGYSS